MKRKEYTMTQEEIVRALRHTCDGCNPTPCCEFEALGPEAADLIESQAAENAAYRAENERLAADLKDMRNQNQTISEKNRELRIKLDEREKNSKATQKAMLDEIAKLRNDLTAKTALLDDRSVEQETLQRAFAESQRRELAAAKEEFASYKKAEPISCGKCHKPMFANDKYCSHCGAREGEGK